MIECKKINLIVYTTDPKEVLHLLGSFFRVVFKGQIKYKLLSILIIKLDISNNNKNL